MNHGFYVVRIESKGSHTGKHVRDSCDMISTEDVDNDIKTTLKLIAVICDIRQTIRWFASRLHNHLILLLSELRKCEPCGTVLFVHQPPLAKIRDRRCDLTIPIQ